MRRTIDTPGWFNIFAVTFGAITLVNLMSLFLAISIYWVFCTQHFQHVYTLGEFLLRWLAMGEGFATLIGGTAVVIYGIGRVVD